MESFCPLLVDLKNRECLVIGGGSVAERKVKVMLAYRAEVTVVSPDLSTALSEMLAGKKISYLADIYRPAYLKNKFMVICATNSEAVNRRAAGDCIERGILVNSVSEPDRCTFFLPALLKKDSLTIAVSTSGNSPALARRIRNEIDSFLCADYGELSAYLGTVRPRVLKLIRDREKRKALLEYFGGDEFFSVFRSKPRSEIDRIVEQMITDRADLPGKINKPGEVAGPDSSGGVEDYK
jgi:precorrin-2 dehydrogenase / sirohydrochlorin ferrochelatase